MSFDPLGTAVAVSCLAFLAFTLSSSAGLGGSLILVPVLAMAMGTKEGIATAAAMLALNNIGKIVAYRKHVPLRAVAGVSLVTILGAAFGASLLLRASAEWAIVAVVTMALLTFLLEKLATVSVRRASAPPLAFVAGAMSGFAGTSGPMKGIALRSLPLERRQFVAAASAVSLAGDATKVMIFSRALLFDERSGLIIAATIPLMVAGVLVGQRINSVIGERGYAALFWAVITGYSVRLLIL